MKKSVLVIIVIAILGILAFYTSNQKNKGSSLGANNLGLSERNQTPASDTPIPTYIDGTYNGRAAETPYGVVQISVLVASGKVAEVNFIKMPESDEYSREVTSFSASHLKKTAIDKQQAQDIDFVTGATATSYGFQESLQAALNQAVVN
jgi:uncharacterized protein with FMN-binding domain